MSHKKQKVITKEKEEEEDKVSTCSPSYAPNSPYESTIIEQLTPGEKKIKELEKEVCNLKEKLKQVEDFIEHAYDTAKPGRDVCNSLRDIINN